MAGRQLKKKPRKAAPKQGAVKRPNNWDKAVSVAYLRLLGASQEVAAKEAGCAKRSITSWEGSTWWPAALNEASQRWLQGGDTLARKGLLQALEDPQEYASTAKWWADRRIPELEPPKQRRELMGKDGEPLSCVEIVLVKPKD